MNEANAKAKLFQKILAVQKSLEPVEKSGRNDFHKYNYTTAGDVLLPVQQACNAHGLIVVADCIDSNIEPGKASVTVKLTVADSETGESLSVTAPGYAEDWSYKDGKPTGDKAIYKATTGALKYATRLLFCLPSEDDPERTSSKPVSNSKPNTNISRSTGALIDQTTAELKRLNWSNDRGKLYLQEKFGKTSRRELSESELQQFLTDLRSQKTPMPLPVN